MMACCPMVKSETREAEAWVSVSAICLTSSIPCRCSYNLDLLQGKIHGVSRCACTPPVQGQQAGNAA